jgi:hypothetical protein
MDGNNVIQIPLTGDAITDWLNLGGLSDQTADMPNSDYVGGNQSHEGGSGGGSIKGIHLLGHMDSDRDSMVEG